MFFQQYSIYTLYSKKFTKSDKIDDKIKDIVENIPNIDDPEAIRDLESIGKSKNTSETFT